MHRDNVQEVHSQDKATTRFYIEPQTTGDVPLRPAVPGHQDASVGNVPDSVGEASGLAGAAKRAAGRRRAGGAKPSDTYRLLGFLWFCDQI